MLNDIPFIAIYQGNPDHYLRSTYYNDFAAPDKAHDPLAIAAPLGGADPSRMALLQFWHDSMQGRRFGERDEIVFVHFRDVAGSMPRFHESFVDEGNFDEYEFSLA